MDYLLPLTRKGGRKQGTQLQSGFDKIGSLECRGSLIMRGQVRQAFRASYPRYRFRSISFVLWKIVVRQIAPSYDAEIRF